MIFVTIGSMFPFDRLIQWMDAWTAAHQGEDVFAQIGEGDYEPSHMAFARMLPPREFERRVREAEVFVAHAGMGSVLTALEMGRSLVLVPRLHALREHTTDHQLHTAAWLRDRPGIQVAESPEALDQAIARDRERRANAPGDRISSRAPEAFTEKIRDYILG